MAMTKAMISILRELVEHRRIILLDTLNKREEAAVETLRTAGLVEVVRDDERAIALSSYRWKQLGQPRHVVHRPTTSYLSEASIHAGRLYRVKFGTHSSKRVVLTECPAIGSSVSSKYNGCDSWVCDGISGTKNDPLYLLAAL